MDGVGFVKAIDGDFMELEFRRISGCGGGCKTCSSHCDVPAHTVKLKNNINAKVGDFVEVEAQTKKILKYALVVYIIPLIFLVSGVALGVNYFKAIGNESYELFGMLIGAIFLGLSLLIVKFIDKRVEKKENDSLKAVRIL